MTKMNIFLLQIESTDDFIKNNLHGLDSRLAAAGLITTPVLRTVVWPGLIAEDLLRHPNSETKQTNKCEIGQ